MGSLTDKQGPKIHALCVPYPAQGHIRPMLKLAKLLHSKGLQITFVNTEYNHRRLLRARGPTSLNAVASFRFEAIPDGLPSSDADVTQDIPSLCYAVMNYFLEPFKELINRVNDPSSGSPPVTVIISDCVMPFTLDAAQEFGLPLVWLWTASACGFLGYYQYRSLLDKGIFPFKDSNFASDGSLDKVVDWVPSMKNIELKYIPSFIRTTNKDDIMFNFLLFSTERAAKSSLPIIFNSFDAFEHDALQDLSKLIHGPMYTIGPMQLLLNITSDDDPAVKSFGSNLWKEDPTCLEWLDAQKEKSVVYVSFGSITTMTNENLIEFAWGLANSKRPFLWILRPDIVTGDSAVIPPEFLAETKERGLIISWCDQEKVLEHASVGAFLTHCGWNSTLDTVCSGVPIICWPFFAEQQTNCWFTFKKWGIGMEIDSEVRRSEVEKQVREIMEGEEGKGMARNVKEWKRLAQDSIDVSSGSSYNNFEKLVKEVFLPLLNDKKEAQN